MFKVVLFKELNVRSGQTPLRFKVRDDVAGELVFDPGLMVDAASMMAFAQDGSVKPGAKFDAGLKKEIDRYKFVLGEVFLDLLQGGGKIDEDSLKMAVLERLALQENPCARGTSVVERFRSYLEEQKSTGRFSEKMYRESYTLSRKLERFLVIKEMVGLLPEEMTLELVVEYEKFCIDEYLYAYNPKYEHLYPRDYVNNRWWPKKKLQEEPLRKVLIHFHTFWNDLVLYGEIERSPYEGYVSWMQPKKYKNYVEVMNEPLSITRDEFMKVVSTPVPESMSETKDAFVLQCCLGCRGEDFKQMSLMNIRISEEGIPYIYYVHKAVRKCARNEFKYDIEVPMVKMAFDIALRRKFNFYFGSYSASYNRRIKELLRFCGITREVVVYNSRTGESESLPICEVLSQGHLHQTHMDIIRELECLRGLRGDFNLGARAMVKMKDMPIEEHFKLLNSAFNQRPYRVDHNLNIIEGAPCLPYDPLVYKEQPEKLFGRRTNPYVISELVPMPSVEGKTLERVEVKYGHTLQTPRKLLVLGSQVGDYLATLEDEHRQQVYYGMILLKILSDFNVTFVNYCKEAIYELRTSLRGYGYSTYFYLNGDSIVLLYACQSEMWRRRKILNDITHIREQRWKHVLGEVEADEFDCVLDNLYGGRGSTKREVYEMRACCSYVSQALRQARLDAGLMQEDIFSKWGHRADCGNLHQAENGIRVLPYKYLERLLEALGLKAVIVRPGLDGWNAISRKRCLEDMLIEIGEPGRGYVKKGRK